MGKANSSDGVGVPKLAGDESDLPVSQAVETMPISGRPTAGPPASVC